MYPFLYKKYIFFILKFMGIEKKIMLNKFRQPVRNSWTRLCIQANCNCQILNTYSVFHELTTDNMVISVKEQYCFGLAYCRVD